VLSSWNRGRYAGLFVMGVPAVPVSSQLFDSEHSGYAVTVMLALAGSGSTAPVAVHTVPLLG